MNRIARSTVVSAALFASSATLADARTVALAVDKMTCATMRFDDAVSFDGLIKATADVGFPSRLVAK